jgi:hypothetical protein
MVLHGIDLPRPVSLGLFLLPGRDDLLRSLVHKDGNLWIFEVETRLCERLITPLLNGRE